MPQSQMLVLPLGHKPRLLLVLQTEEELASPSILQYFRIVNHKKMRYMRSVYTENSGALTEVSRPMHGLANHKEVAVGF